MAGWTCPDGENQIWDGTICATHGFKGDGSRITGLGGASDTQARASNAENLVYITTNTASSAELLEDADIASQSIILNTAKVSYTDAAVVAANTASNAEIRDDYEGASAAIVVNSAKVSYTDAAAVAINTASRAELLIYTDENSASSAENLAYITAGSPDTTARASCAELLIFTDENAASSAEILALSVASSAENLVYNTANTGSCADIVDPHTTYLTQTSLLVTANASAAVHVNTGDYTITSGACVNVYVGTSATAPAANSTPLGSLYVQYTN